MCPKDEKEKSYNRFRKWNDRILSVNELIEYKEFLDNINFDKMEERYLAKVENKWFHGETSKS